MTPILDYDSNTVSACLCAIHFEAYKDIRKIAVDFEKSFKEVRDNKVVVLPVGDDEPGEVTRFVSMSAGYVCEFSTDRVTCNYRELPEPKSDLRSTLLTVQSLVKQTYNRFFQLTKSRIIKAGMVVDMNIPTREPRDVVKLILDKFFKFAEQNPDLSEIDFHYSQKREAKYNINVVVKPRRVGELPRNDTISVTIDINNYEEAKNNPSTTHDDNLISDIASMIENYFYKDMIALLEEGTFAGNA